MNRGYWKSIIVLAIQLSVVLFIAMNLPENTAIPAHWNFQGEVDSYLGITAAIIIFFSINLAILLGLMFLPFYSTRYKESKQRYDKILPTLTFILVSTFALLHIYIFLGAAQILPLAAKYVMLIIAFLFIALGNLLPKVPSGYFIGIRTPWSLSSETVWRQTHRWGGFSFVLAGILLLINAFVLPNGSIISTFAIILFFLLLFWPLVYSFVLYKKEVK